MRGDEAERQRLRMDTVDLVALRLEGRTREGDLRDSKDVETAKQSPETWRIERPVAALLRDQAAFTLRRGQLPSRRPSRGPRTVPGSNSDCLGRAMVRERRVEAVGRSSCSPDRCCFARPGGIQSVRSVAFTLLSTRQKSSSRTEGAVKAARRLMMLMVVGHLRPRRAASASGLSI
jgi:hypothetical protein